MFKTSLRFIGFLLLVVLVVFLGHIYVLHLKQLPLFENKIILSYVINFVVAVVILLVIERSITKESAHGGFIFMGGSGLKFLLFFVIFYPSFKEDNTMSTVEFMSFFIPYAICLILEVMYLSKKLNNQVFSSKNEE